ncbi:MAG: suppressor of fused domain protein [Planctomycetaceae bacterium]|jgi:hypothetical protein|nr:suppressor of fused domain protein [Planctomycetaceae bacterium]
MSDIISHGKHVCNHLKTLFDDKPSFSRFWDSQNENPITIATWQNRPEIGLSTIMTVDLSYYPLVKYGELYTKGKAEIMSVCIGDDHTVFEDIIAQCARCVVNKYFCCPNAIFPDVIKIYVTSSEMKHVFFDKPFLWSEDLSCAVIENIKTMWLMAIPISDAEYQYAIEHNVEKLGKLFEKEKIEYWDINRKSIL